MNTPMPNHAQSHNKCHCTFMRVLWLITGRIATGLARNLPHLPHLPHLGLPIAIQSNASLAPEQATVNPVLALELSVAPPPVVSSNTTIAGVALYGMLNAMFLVLDIHADVPANCPADVWLIFGRYVRP